MKQYADSRAKPRPIWTKSSNPLALPRVYPDTAASTMSAKVSVMTVAPTDRATALLAARPMLRRMGYTTRVYEANSEPSSSAEANE